MYTANKHIFFLGTFTLLLFWNYVSETQANKRYGRATRNKFMLSNPYKFGQLDYNRPGPYMKGSLWRLTLLIPHEDGTKNKESVTLKKREITYNNNICTPYNVYLSYK